jgi:hypothetical protein
MSRPTADIAKLSEQVQLILNGLVKGETFQYRRDTACEWKDSQNTAAEMLILTRGTIAYPEEYRIKPKVTTTHVELQHYVVTNGNGYESIGCWDSRFGTRDNIDRRLGFVRWLYVPFTVSLKREVTQ